MEEIRLNSNKCSRRCFQPYWEWIIQILIWLEIPALIYGFIEDFLLHVPFWTGLFIYPIYIITIFCSNTFFYLRNLNSNQTINEKMGEYFQAAPTITFTASCYHYETRTVKTIDRRGNQSSHIEKVKVVTRHTSQQFRFYSTKDVSGLFFLNANETGLICKKGYIKLYLEQEINFADSVSYADYISQKLAFWKDNRFYDTHMEFTETREIPGFETYNLIRINEYKPCCVSVSLFIFFVFFPFAQLYKLYIESLSMTQRFKIRKVISTRNNLLNENSSAQYETFQPTLNLNNQLFTFAVKDTGMVNAFVNVSPPSQDEINNAHQYDDYIPKYEVLNLDGRNAVVQD